MGTVQAGQQDCAGGGGETEATEKILGRVVRIPFLSEEYHNITFLCPHQRRHLLRCEDTDTEWFWYAAKDAARSNGLDTVVAGPTCDTDPTPRPLTRQYVNITCPGPANTGGSAPCSTCSLLWNIVILGLQLRPGNFDLCYSFLKRALRNKNTY